MTLCGQEPGSTTQNPSVKPARHCCPNLKEIAIWPSSTHCQEEEHYFVAASSALRVYRENATLEDAALIRDFIELPNPIVKRHTLYAIAYMGGNRAILPKLLEATLAVDIGTDPNLADALTDAFGPYGVPFSLLTEQTAGVLLRKFIHSTILTFAREQSLVSLAPLWVSFRTKCSTYS